MPRAARVRRAPNREPASLAAAIPTSDVVEAIDTVDPVDPVVAVAAHIDLARTNNDAYSTPTPLISKNTSFPMTLTTIYILYL